MCPFTSHKTLCLAFLSILFIKVITKPVTPTYEAVGCFQDDHVNPRPLPILVANLRKFIDWSNLNKTIEKCARKTFNHPFLKLKYFGIQFYGECYSGVKGEKTYNNNGPSKNCTKGVGKDWTNFVYKFVSKTTPSQTQILGQIRKTTTYSPTTKELTSSHVITVNSPRPAIGPVPECLQYEKLSVKSRSEFTVGGKRYCDRNLPLKWYRFTGPAGSHMSTHCVPTNRCGAHAPGWLNGAHPSEKEGSVTRTVCFNWRKKCCRWESQIQVRNCGGYFVYKLSPVKACYLRYCGNGRKSATGR